MNRVAEGLSDAMRESLTLRPLDEVARFFDGLDLVEPGIVQISRWRGEPGDRAPDHIYGGLGPPRADTPPMTATARGVTSIGSSSRRLADRPVDGYDLTVIAGRSGEPSSSTSYTGTVLDIDVVNDDPLTMGAHN